MKEGIKDIMKESKHYLITGNAGTGKTTTALRIATKQLNLDGFSKIVIIKNTVQVRNLGFLPGSLNEKILHFFSLYGPLFKNVTKISLASLLQKKKVIFESTAFLRGTTYNNAVVIVDEAQNMSYHELKTILTRIGKTSMLIVVGDEDQMDVKKSESGYDKFIRIYTELNNVGIIIETKNYRSDLVNDFIEKENRQKNVDSHYEGLHKFLKKKLM
jgi:phosphate starvation-inducible PhoH-like protein